MYMYIVFCEMVHFVLTFNSLEKSKLNRNISSPAVLRRKHIQDEKKVIVCNIVLSFFSVLSIFLSFLHTSYEYI